VSVLLPAAAVVFVFIGALIVERLYLMRLQARIPIRVCVTGTRGKSTVTRYIAAALRASGRTVLAKTTGSKPAIILPDGEEREIRRNGLPSILEQKMVLALAGRLRVEALVTEMMSIGPECLAAESKKIIRPELLVVTNVRLDHEEEMGRTKEAVAASLAAAVPPGGTVLLPERERYPVFDHAAERALSRVVSVSSSEDGNLSSDFDFLDNIRLALAAAAHCGVDRSTALRGIACARPDFGSLRMWTAVSPLSGQTWRFAGLFAANEPESTGIAWERIRRRSSFTGQPLIAVLNLRADRASRTRQWLEAVRSGFFAEFDRLVFIGEQASALARIRFPRGEGIPLVTAIAGRSAEKVMASLWPLCEGEAAVIGVGNIAGIGRALIEHWDAVGSPTL
jgi:poly-gamma-glutamate synthase PgsB/CapB